MLALAGEKELCLFAFPEGKKFHVGLSPAKSAKGLNWQIISEESRRTYKKWGTNPYSTKSARFAPC